MTDDRRHTHLLGLSVAWGYGFAVLLLAFILAILVPEPEGPSPWDPVAFRKGTIELIANFRILDELADLGIVKVADVGDGLLTVDLESLGVSNRKFGLAPFYVALVAMVLSLFLRAMRLRVLTRHVGVPSTVKGQLPAFFFGRGLNLFFPFGPGELGTIRALTDAGAPAAAAATAVFHGRVLEVVAIGAILAAGLVYLGWGGAVEPFVWAAVLIAGVVSLTRPLGRSGVRGRRRIAESIRTAFGGDALSAAVRQLLRSPAFFLGVLVLSLLAFGLEILAFWSIKQAFSSPMDDYVLMKDLPVIPFAIVVAAAGLARVIPYTFAGLGIVELVMVVMFRAFDESFLAGTTVALLCALLMNACIFACFQAAIWVSRCPNVLDVWQTFFDQSAARAAAEELRA